MGRTPWKGFPASTVNHAHAHVNIRAHAHARRASRTTNERSRLSRASRLSWASDGDEEDGDPGGGGGGGCVLGVLPCRVALTDLPRPGGDCCVVFFVKDDALGKFKPLGKTEVVAGCRHPCFDDSVGLPRDGREMYGAHSRPTPSYLATRVCTRQQNTDVKCPKSRTHVPTPMPQTSGGV